jgi:glycosyltransferase involved in cell wall biosynthesis
VNGVGYLVKVASEMLEIEPDVLFVAIGDGKEEAEIRDTARTLGVMDNNFVMLPARSKAEVVPWLSAADVSLSTVIDVPALWANSANKVFDAFAAGRPVAINHEGWLADLFRETGAGLVLDPRDHRRAAGQLAEALRDGRWQQGAREAARRLAREQFDRDLLVARLERVLLDVASQRERPETKGSSTP